MLAKKLERFRKKHNFSIPQFCAAGHIHITQYRRYLSGHYHLSVKDAVMLMASFPKELDINTLLGMITGKRLFLEDGFPSFRFMDDPKQDIDQTERIFTKFYFDTALRSFSARDSINLLAAMTSLCCRSELWLPLAENMYSLMYSLREIRKLKFSGFGIPSQTALTHFQRKRLITRFSDLCEYEGAFHSGGLYLLSELMYLNEKNNYGIRLTL